MNDTVNKNLRLIFPQWQGGNNESYYFGSQLLAWLSPEAKGVTVEVPVTEPADKPLKVEQGIVGRKQVVSQLSSARELVRQHSPDTIVTLGGDCLVSLAPFSYLIEKYGEKLGVLWVDSHPDVMTPEQFAHSHAHVLGALMGNGDPDLTRDIVKPLSPEKIMIAGIHDPLAYEQEFIASRGIMTCGPDEVRQGGQAVQEWIAHEKIEFLAIHLDLDVLDPATFRSVLFARPGRGLHDFGDAAEGRLSLSEVTQLIGQAASATTPVGLTVAEHLPWDAINLRRMLASLPLMK